MEGRTEDAAQRLDGQHSLTPCRGAGHTSGSGPLLPQTKLGFQSGHMHKPDHASKHQLGHREDYFFGFLNEH